MSEITKEVLDERYTVFTRNKERYKEVVLKIRGLFDAAAKTKDVSFLLDYEKEYKRIEDIRTAETYRLDIIKNILVLEKEHGATNFFFEDCDTCEELLEHYKRCTLYIRRLEMPLSAELKEEAISYLLEKKVSGIAILSVLSNEQYEHRDYLCKLLYERLCANLDLMQRFKNLDYYSEYMDDTTFKLNKAFLFLENGDRKSARECLLKINNPSVEICDFIKKLEA